MNQIVFRHTAMFSKQNKAYLSHFKLSFMCDIVWNLTTHFYEESQKEIVFYSVSKRLLATANMMPHTLVSRDNTVILLKRLYCY